MNRGVLLTAIAAAAIATAGFWQAPRPQSGLVRAVPPGALLVLEVKDLSALVRDWNQSTRKPRWLASDNYAVFSRSRLFQRLADLQGEYAAAAGFAPDYSLVELCAGGTSTLALYDIPGAEFLYLTRTSAADTVEKLIARSSAKFEPREAAGQRYFVRTEKQTGRSAAFAAVGDVLLLATREDLLASALASLKGEARASVDEEPWYNQPVSAAGPAGDLRLVMNLEALVKTPHFRSYWIQRNTSELRQFRSAVSDVTRYPDRIDERRLLFRSQAAPVAAGAGSAGSLLPLVPDDAGFYRAADHPDPADLVSRLNRKLIDPGPSTQQPTRFAPAAISPDSVIGSPADLEIRIDEPPLDVKDRVDLQPLRALLAGNRILAGLEIGSTEPLPGGVFLEPRQAVVLLGGTAWNEAASRAAFPPEVTVQTRGPLLIAGRDPRQVQVMLERTDRQRPNNLTYAAGFRYAPEFDRFMNLFHLLEQGNRSDSYQSQPGGVEAPRFFSGNLGSLGRTLLTMSSASITVRDTGDRMEEQVQYRLAP